MQEDTGSHSQGVGGKFGITAGHIQRVNLGCQGSKCRGDLLLSNKKRTLGRMAVDCQRGIGMVQTHQALEAENDGN
eukprot:scaffold1207_cov79-Cylindrotheca_fusiformis.AAC.1